MNQDTAFTTLFDTQSSSDAAVDDTVKVPWLLDLEVNTDPVTPVTLREKEDTSWRLR